jgi:prepilin-type processing-associated H-X9-DG protein
MPDPTIQCPNCGQPLSDHKNGMNVLFGDGHVEFLNGVMAQKVESELKAGQNPPPSYRGF